MYVISGYRSDFGSLNDTRNSSTKADFQKLESNCA